METYVYALLRNHKDAKALLEVGKSFGVALSIANHEPEHFINLGGIVHEDLEFVTSDVPYGYEEEAITKYRLVEQLSLCFQGNDNIDRNALLTLKTIEVFPKCSDNVPKVEVNTLTSDINISVGSHTQLELSIDFNTDFTGHLKRLLLLTMEIVEKPEALVVRRTEFTMGIIIIGTVLPVGLDREVAIHSLSTEESNNTAVKQVEQKLSVEAKPFTPIALVSAFDIQCHTISLATCPQPLINAFCPPPHFLLALMHPALVAEYIVPEQLSQEIDYLSHLRANTLDNVVKQMNLCHVSDLVESHTLSAVLSYQYSADILSNHAKLISLEEIQTKIDIAQYDMHYVYLQTTRKDNPFQWSMQGGTNMMTAKLKIPGSSENRPKLQLGGDIYLRPVEEDLLKVASFGFNAEMFELRGVCIHYQLSSEEAIFEFPNIYLNTAGNMLDDLFQTLRFHVRFGYEHNGFCFIRWAVRNISQDRYLVECLFPTEDTMARLKAHAATQQFALNTGPPGLNIRKTNLENFLREGTLLASSSQPPSAIAAMSVQSLQVEESGIGRSSLSPFSSNSPDVPDFNAQQLEAINTIVTLAKDSRWTTIRQGYTDEAQQGHLPMPPFIIYGPPGTGKTSTVAEAILRVCRLYPAKRILACAPSDAAADVLCERLARYLSPPQLFRLNWWQRVSASMPAKLRPYSLDMNDIFELPRIEVLQVYQVIVCSCGTAGVLKALPTEKISFDMVFVDEASQAIEAEVLVPLELCRHGGVMVLSGDTNQLGPSTRCPLFPLCTDGASLQERLLRLPFYADCWPENAKRSRHLTLTSRAPPKRTGTGRWGYETASWAAHMDSSRNTSAINLSALKSAPSRRSNHSRDDLCLGVFLYKNYRSHRAILELPSRLFYADALEECADRNRTEFLSDWERMPRRPADGQAFPMMMIGVDGQHQHEMESPSFYNTAEIAKVVEICGDLVRTSSLPPGTVSAKDIGVIAAFRQQVLRLRVALRAAGLSNVNVGSVEDFQGQEVKIVVISTVLSEWADRFETQGSIGLMGDAKRFNVAITRGMALCVVVGQPRLLYSDPRWREMLKYTIANGGYSGLDISDFLRQPRRNKAEEGSASDEVEQGYEGWNSEEEDEMLLNSLAEVASTMAAVDSSRSGLAEGSSVSAVVSRFDMEWRNIL